MLAVAYYPFEVALPTAGYWLLGGLTAILFFAGILLHELGHSALAQHYRIPVRRITLLIFGGVAEIGGEPPSALAELELALAGPLVSFALAALFGALAVALSALTPLFVLAKYLAVINLSLALFNLIPGYPLDGGRVLRAIVWSLTGSLSRATRLAATLGRVIALLGIVLGIWQLLSADLAGLWLVFIGWFLFGAASQQLGQLQMRDFLARQAVAEATSHGFVAVPAEATLQLIVEQNLVNVGARAFVVRRGGVDVGFLTWRSINAVPREEWPATRAAQAMIPSARPSVDRSGFQSAINGGGQDYLEGPPAAEGSRSETLRHRYVISFLRRLHLHRASH